MCQNLKADIGRYIKDPYDIRNLYLLFEQGIWALVAYRFGRFAQAFPIPIISHILKLIAFLWFKLNEILFGISLPGGAKIGKGLYIGHFGGMIVHYQVEMGENCSIGPGVVIGTKGVGNQGVPKIGNNVYIGVGAKVLGNIRI